MNSKNAVFRKTGLLYTLLTALINLVLTVVLSVVPGPNIDEDTTSKWVAFISSASARYWGIIVPYVVPVLLCVGYSLRGGTEEKLKKRAVSMPTFMALTSLIGWFANFVLVIFYAFCARRMLGIGIRAILIMNTVSNPLAGISASTLVFLVLEGLNQKLLLPVFFPEGRVSAVRTAFRPGLGLLLSLGFVISSLPVAYTVYGMISLLVNNGIAVHKGLLFITSFILLAAAIVTFMLAKKIVKPLTLLTQAAEQVKRGNYGKRLSIISNDEMGTLVDSFNDMTASLAEKEQMRDTFGKVVDPTVRDYLMKGTAALRGESRVVTVMFCDIRNFTAMSEKMEAEAVVSLLNRYFTVLGKCISAHNGVINKYIGDAIMAMFGVPVASSRHAQDAYLAALDMRTALAELNRELTAEGKAALRFGIGIHTGRVFAGTIGAQDRMEYTIIGDTVNTASRMESLCKSYGTDILLSQTTADGLESPSGLVFVDNAGIRGRVDRLAVYRIADPPPLANPGNLL
ncbi:MAG: HAMP domain-containing protein [Treponema sp.]|nr:HAMP domain-containing protein [Treponema sp.]